MRQRRRRHERPGFINDGAVLAAINAAFRAAYGGGLTASVDRRCARRLPKLRPGRRNAAQPDKETFRSPLRRERRSIRRFSGRMTPAFPKRRPRRDDGLGQAAFPLGGAWRKPGNPAI